MLQRSPMRRLAINRLQQQFSDLLSVQAEVGDLERSLIEGIYELMWMDSDNLAADLEWSRTTRAAFHFVDKGFLIKQEEVAQAFTNVIDQITIFLNTTWSKRAEAQRATAEDSRIELYLAYYKKMYEGLIPWIMAPVVFGFSIANNISDPSFLPRHDGKIGLKAIQKMENWIRKPQNRLAIGLNSHIRNAYSHENYRILDGGRVELWDVDPYNPKKKWGPEIWTLAELEKLCNELWLNALAVSLALAIFSMNNRRLMTSRGWAEPTRQPIALRKDELEHLVKALADYSSFHVDKVEKSNSTLLIAFATKLRGIDQDEEIIVGHTEGPPQFFKSPVKYKEMRVIEMVTGFLQRMQSSLVGIQQVSITVEDPNGKSLGDLLIDVDKISKIKGPDKSTIESERKLFQVDNVGDSKMWVRMESLPRDS